MQLSRFKIMKKEHSIIRFSTIAFFILLAGIYRILPHPGNFSPIGAMALFGGAYYASRLNSFIVPLITLWLSDIILNNVIYSQYFKEFTLFYDGFYWVYGSFILVACIGRLLQNNVTFISVPMAAIASALLFFIVSNFGVWISGTMYPHNFIGLVACYTAGIPFFSTSLVGDLLFSGILFGSFELLRRYFPVLQPALVKN